MPRRGDEHSWKLVIIGDCYECKACGMQSAMKTRWKRGGLDNRLRREKYHAWRNKGEFAWREGDYPNECEAKEKS